MKARIQIQVPGGSFTKPSITLTRKGNSVLLPISKKAMATLRKVFKKIPEEG